MVNRQSFLRALAIFTLRVHQLVSYTLLKVSYAHVPWQDLLTASEASDLIVDTGCSAGFVNFFVCGSDFAVAYVVHDGVIEQHGVLRNNTNAVTKATRVSHCGRQIGRYCT